MRYAHCKGDSHLRKRLSCNKKKQNMLKLKKKLILGKRAMVLSYNTIVIASYR